MHAHYRCQRQRQNSEIAMSNLSQTVSTFKASEIVLLDIGCGVGNAMFPLLKDLPNLRVNALDFSKRAV